MSEQVLQQFEQLTQSQQVQVLSYMQSLLNAQSTSDTTDNKQEVSGALKNLIAQSRSTMNESGGKKMTFAQMQAFIAAKNSRSVVNA